MKRQVSIAGPSRAGLTASEDRRHVGYGEAWQNTLPTMTDTGEVDFRSFIRTLNRRKLLLVLSIATIMAATLLWVTQVTPVYEADALIVIETRPSSIVTVDEAVQDVSRDDAKVDTGVAVLESRSLAARVILDLALHKDPEFAPEGPEDGSWVSLATKKIRAVLYPVTDSMPHLIPSIEARDQSIADADVLTEEVVDQLPERAVEQDLLLTAMADDLPLAEPKLAIERAALLNRYLRHLSVTSEESSRLVRISFRSTDPIKAARIANKIVEDYIDSQLETKSEGARSTAQWLEARLAELGANVRSLEQEVQEQRDRTGTNDMAMVGKTSEQLNGELVVAKAAAAASRARYQQAEDVLTDDGNLEALPSVIASATIQALRVRMTGLAGKLSDLRTIYGEKHPEIVAIRAEIADLGNRRNVEIDNILSGLRNEVRSAEIREARLRDELESFGAEMTRLKGAEASIEQVAQRLQANRELYGNLLKRHTEAMALRDNQQPDARVISPAQIPLKPSFPNLPRILMLAFIGSASLSTILLVLVERFRQKLDSVEDVERHIALPVIGAIPDLPRLWRMKSAPSDYMQREPLSEFGSAFQRLRALLVLGNERRMPKSVLVTSATAGEGKTTTAVCLGVACVTSGQKVLLIDCDFGRPRLHEMVKVSNDIGLTDIFNGSATIQEAIATANGFSLSILTIGRSREGAIDLLNYGRMEDLLIQIEDQFDTIILDSAPVLDVSNTLILGGLAEKTILVARRHWTSHRKASEAVRQLQLYGAELSGVVFTRADITNS